VEGKHVGRRRFLVEALQLGGGIVALGVSGFVGLRWIDDRATASPPPSKVSTTTDTTSVVDPGPYVSRPDLNPPTIAISRQSGWTPSLAADGAYFFIAPKASRPGVHGQYGLMIVDVRGELVWFRQLPGHLLTDLQVQTYRGQPVLTWFDGHGANDHGLGTGYVADATYRVIATVHAGNGLKVDGHEFNLTPSGTALITTYYSEKADLSSLGGPRDGVVFGCQAQEIDVATGKLLFAWNSLDHVGVEESYKAFSGGTSAAPFDYFHINSVALAPDGDIVISARNTWAVYKVSRRTGNVVWRLGGKRSDFHMGPGTDFYWQHDARALSTTRLSLFDDGASPSEERQSRALILDVNETTRQCRLVRSYTHPGDLLASSQGSIQVLPSQRVVVGWGNLPYFSEFLADGTMILEGRIPAGLQSYRAFRFPWAGGPSAPPDVAVRASDSGYTVYVSWNGDTRTTQWRLLVGPSPSALGEVATAPRTGFETTLTSTAAGPYFAVAANDTDGNQLAVSATVRA